MNLSPIVAGICALGFSFFKTLHKIIFPQMIKNSSPVFMNEIAVLIKETAILASIGVVEITKVAQNINAKMLQPMPIYLTVAVLYLILTSSVKLVAKRIEKGLDYDKG